ALDLSNLGQRIGHQVSGPSLSADGRFVTFDTFSDQIVANDTNSVHDVFVHDRLNGVSALVSQSADGVQSESTSGRASLSGDGRFIVFETASALLTPDDTNGTTDVFVTVNSLIESGVSRSVVAGERVANFDFGLIPAPGQISGRVFEDFVENGVFDAGEPDLVGWTVFLDANRNRVFDEGETFVVTDADGIYDFEAIPGFRDHSVAVDAPAGWEQIAPAADAGFTWDLFLPAGGDIAERDFAFRRIESTGQSSSSALSGRLYDDVNDNGTFDAGVDAPLAGREVYLDATNFGVRDPDEPRELTAADGTYLFEGLSPRNVAVTTTLDQTLVHQSPLGSDFTLNKFPLFQGVTPFGNPQAIAAGDFNADGFEDVVVALGEANSLEIRLNDGSGGFLPELIKIDLGTAGSGPSSIALGQFDDDLRLDLAVTANFASNVTVLLNFDAATKQFLSRADLAVGEEPIDIVVGQFAGDAKPDLIVVNGGGVSGDETLNLLTNDGSGVFAVGPSIATGGSGSVSIVAGDFTGDSSLDVAVVHSAPATSDTPLGGATVLAGDGNGGLSLQPEFYTLGAFPIDSATADFNGDGRDDLAVANFSSNSISVLLGQSDGTFRVQESILGTASGAFDIAVGDIDNDGDPDVIASNLRDRNISIFRNVGVDSTTNEVRFEPLENIGLGQFTLAQRMPLVVANFDNDTSGPNGSGTVDIVTIPRLTDTLHVLRNRLVDGSHRVALTGLNAISGLDFIISPSTLAPAFDAIPNPAAIIEDSAEQLTTINGISKGRPSGPALQFSVTSSNLDLIDAPTIDFTDGESTATVRYTPLANASGNAVLTVSAIDAGADQIIGSDDDGVFERSFTVVVLPVDESSSIILQGSGNTFFLTQSDSQLDGVQLIDIRGTGDNTLMLDADRIRDAFAGVIGVLSDAGDAVVFDDGWEFAQALLNDGQLVRRFEQLGATLDLVGPDDFTNPISQFDVNANGDISSLDALQIINELGRRAFSDGQGSVRSVAEVDLDFFRFYDVTGDLRITALDALRVINQLGSQQGDGELIEIAPLAAARLTNETPETEPSSDPIQSNLPELRHVSGEIAPAALSPKATEINDSAPQSSAETEPSTEALDQLLADESFIELLR
ncbi:MAG: FG-GAP-like repeat-containing protein, partial [Rubripirellula sp.]